MDASVINESRAAAAGPVAAGLLAESIRRLLIVDNQQLD
jgi:ornithine cyclodeaminase/alanine dehydrogenase-like protein (mu-crystallin family)